MHCLVNIDILENVNVNDKYRQIKAILYNIPN